MPRQSFVSLLFLLPLLHATAVHAQAPAYKVKQIGATFLEAPPGRDKNLVPFGSFGSQEKVETHAVVEFSNRIVADVPTFQSDAKVVASAIGSDKSVANLGTAEGSSFRKISEDRKKTLISMSVARLPDQKIAGVRFSGTVKFHVAKSESRASVKFEPKLGAKVVVGADSMTVSKIDGSVLTFAGGDWLKRIAAVKLVKADGGVLTATRTATGTVGGTDGIRVDMQWQFSGPLVAGKLELTLLDGLEAIDVPIDLIVAKPY